MTTLFTDKVRTSDDALGVKNRRYRVIKARSMERVLNQVNRLTRWGWTLERIWGVTPSAIVVKNEVVANDGEQVELLFPQRYDAETKAMISVYYKYATKWAITQEKMVHATNIMLARGYEVSFHVTTTFGYRTVFHKTYVKNMAEDKA